MAIMRAVDAAMHVLEKEGITTAFGVPGAAINPFYDAMRRHGGIKHYLARHVEGASHMAEGYTRAAAGNIGVCIGTSGPAGTDMITGLYSASADSIPILCITGQAPRARLHKEDFQAVDIESIAKPVTKMAVTVQEPALVPRVLQQAFHLMRSGRPGPVLIDLPFDVQMAEIEFDPDTYSSLPAYKPAATQAQIDKALDLLCAAKKPLIIAGGGIHNADAADLLQQLAEICNVPVIPTLMGWGAIPDDHPLMAGMAGLQTSHRQPLGQPPHRLGGQVHRRAQGGAHRYRADADWPGDLPGSGHRFRRAHRAANAGGHGKAPLRARRVAESRRLVRRLSAAQANAAAQDPLRQRAGQAAAGV